MKRFIRWFLGLTLVGYVTGVLAKALAMAERNLLAYTDSERFWHWLARVMEEYASLNGYIRDRRTFGNEVWEEGMTRHSSRLFQELKVGFNLHNRYVNCNMQIDLAIQATQEIIDLLKLRRRQSIAERSEMISLALESIIELGEKERYNLMGR